MFVIKKKIIFFTISSLLVVASIVIMAVDGLNYGIEFTGGTLVEVSFDSVVDSDNKDDEQEVGQENGEVVISEGEQALADEENTSDINSQLLSMHLVADGFPSQVQAYNDGESFIIRTIPIDESNRDAFQSSLEEVSDGAYSIERLNSIGPSIGTELKRKAIIALVLVAVFIILFVAYAFRRPSDDDDQEKKKTGPSSWLFGFIAVTALLHDIIIPVGVSSLLGIEVNPLFVVGLLSILGLSVNDTIVVFDRIRENLIEHPKVSFAENVGNSLTQTIIRSINTSLTLIIVLIILFIFGPVSTQGLALVMIVGTIVGTYSSIFLASPLLVAWYSGEKKEKKNKKNKEK